MPFTTDQQERITAALRDKLKGPCPSCGQFMRQFFPELMVFFIAVTPPRHSAPNFFAKVGADTIKKPTSLRDLFSNTYPDNTKKQSLDPPAPGTPTAAVPCIITTCMNCGFTEFYNVHVLGIADALGIPPGGGPFGT